MLNYELIAKALMHRTKRRILETMAKGESSHGRGVFSPTLLAGLLDEPLGNVSYHVADMAGTRKDSKFKDTPILELVDTAQRRGALEHFYSLSDEALVGTDLDTAEGQGRR